MRWDRRARGAALAALALGMIVGGAAQAATLTVHVKDGQTGSPLTGAFVMLGIYPGDPFYYNVGYTDGGGTVVFDDPSLTGAQTVTAGARNFGYTTLYRAALDEVTLPLYPVVLDPTMGGTATTITGTVASVETVSNDGYLDAALVLPAVSVSDYVFQDMNPYYAPWELASFPIAGEIALPTNLYLPDQVELLFFHFSRTPWRMDVPGDRVHTFFSVSARVAIADLLAGAESALQNMEVQEVGVERDVQVSGPMALQVTSDLALTRSVTAHFYGVPSGDEILAVSGALIDGGDRELALAFDTRGGLIDTASVVELASRAPGGDLSDATNVVLGAYADSSVAVRYSAGIVDREGFVPPHTAVFQNWMLLPVLTQRGHYFAWEDPTNPGVSPSPTWTRSNLGLRAIDAADTSVAVSTYWRVYAPAGPRNFLLPLLPETAPGPRGGLPDPDETADADQLYWTFVATNSSGTGAEVIDDFIRGATHWTQRWDPIQEFSTGVDDGSPIPPSIVLQAAPNPAATEVRLRWSTALTGNGRLELRGPDGRLIRGFGAPLAGAQVRWDGRDAQGRPVPAGVYWATLLRAGERLAAQRVIWLRTAP
jgi:hypothetical protein